MLFALFKLPGYNFADVFYFDGILSFIHTTSQLQNTAGTIAYKNISLGLGNLIQLLPEYFSRYFRKVNRVGSAEAAAHLLIH